MTAAGTLAGARDGDRPSGGVARRHRAVATLAAILLAAGCSSDAAPPSGGRWAGTVDTLPGGTVVVRSPGAGMWDSASTWRIEEELRIGTADEEGPELFGDVAGLAVDSTGRIWVLDGQADELRVFDQDGRFVRTVARRGGGPGELGDAAGVFVVEGGGEVLVVDYGNQRYARWDTAGRAVGSVRRSFGFRRYPFVGAVDPAGGVLEQNVVQPTRAESGRDVVFRVDTTGAVTDTIALPDFEPERVTVLNEAGLPMMSRTVPFAPTLAYHVDSRGHVWAGVSDRYRIAEISSGGDTVRVLERDATPLPVTDDDLDEALEGWDEFERLGPRLDRSRIPSTRPLFGRLWTDDRDHLWVQADAPRELRGRTLDVFGADGRYLGRATSGFALNHSTVPLVVGDRLYAVVRDSLDVQYVVRARIIGRTP